MPGELASNFASRRVTVGDLDVEEAEWVVLFRALDEEERDALFQIVRNITIRRTPTGTVRVPASGMAALNVARADSVRRSRWTGE